MSKTLPTIVILHGWSLEKELKNRWQPLMTLLTDHGFQVKYLSLPGFDLSLETSWKLNDYRDYVLDHTKKYNKVVILGHSFGGQIASRVAASKPKNLIAMVLIGPSGIIDGRWRMKMKRAVFKNLAKGGEGLLGFIGQKESSISYLFLQKKLHHFAREKDYLEAPDILKITMRNVLSDEIKEDLSRIDVPTLIFWGDQDKFTPINHAAIFTAYIPNAQLRLLRGEGHRPYFTQPELLAQNIANFLHKNVA
ncbi:MAG: Alpha/beta hydrolase fold protein [Microgenomates bacterium 39_7]|nr:MAG: Alpha/beta hydrolase fold protein [Microgenomates bacterium 39_7]